MAVIVDYYKNDRIYNNNLNELVPTTLNEYNIDNNLQKLVHRYDELTFGKRKELSDIAYNITCDEETLIYYLEGSKISVGFYYNLNKDFIIETFIGEEYAIGNIPFTVSHIFNNNSHIIRIERDVNHGYIPVMDLISMKEAYTNNYISKERINTVCDELGVVNESLNSYYKQLKLKK